MNEEFARANERAGASAASTARDADDLRQPSRMSLRFLKSQHLRKSADFRHLYEQGRRAGDDHLLVFALPNDSTLARIGVSVSRRHGGAVVRNRRRRLLREAFRLTQHQLPTGVDFVLVPRQRSDSTLADFQHSLRKLAQKLASRWPERRPRDVTTTHETPTNVPTKDLTDQPAQKTALPSPDGDLDTDHVPA